MAPEKILTDCLDRLASTVLIDSYGERALYYNPGRKLKRGVYILTIKEKDGPNDKSSRLDREKVYRLNIGIRKSTFLKLFGVLPNRPGKGETVGMDVDFSLPDRILPHPVYAWMGWICVLNPSKATFETLKPLIAEAYEYAKEKYGKR